MIFNVFAAAVIGGISLNGGQGRMIGALTGVLLLGLLQNVLTCPASPLSGSMPATARSSCSH
jgi:ribose/xylose/arabinose/galactoside ABC-type transport system permease subunit